MMGNRFSLVLNLLSIALDSFSMSFLQTEIEKVSTLSHARIRDSLDRDA